jgi:hypothetical protein
MAHFVFPAVAVILSVPFVAISYNAAAAQERGTCSQARSQCGTQPVCQRRYQACMETGRRALEKMRISSAVSR